VVSLRVTKSSFIEDVLPVDTPTGQIGKMPFLEYALVKEANRPYVTVKVLPFLGIRQVTWNKSRRLTSFLKNKWHWHH